MDRTPEELDAKIRNAEALLAMNAAGVTIPRIPHAAVEIIQGLIARVAELEAELEGFHSERSYIVGANDGWEAAVEQGQASPAVGKAMVRFWKRLAETHLARAEAAEAELKRSREALATFKRWDFPSDIQDLTVRLDAAEAELARRGQGVQVKPLVWPDFREGGTCGHPHHFQYFVTQDHQGRFWAHFDTSQHETLEAAQQHCDQHYQRAALVSPGDAHLDDLAADTELARLRDLIAGLDPDHWGLQARVVALKAEALRGGGA